MKPPLLVVATLVATTLAIANASAQTAPTPPKPNVIVVVWDDVGWEDVIVARTPVLDAFSPASRIYVNHRSCPICSPTRAGLHFGRLPSRDGCGAGLHVLSLLDHGVPKSTESLAERLGAEGYATGMFGKWHVSTVNDVQNVLTAANEHGYDTWRAGKTASISTTGSHYNWPRIDDGVETTETTYASEAVNDAFVAWWNSTPGPKYANVSMFAPHVPYDAAPPHLLPVGYPTPTTPREKYESSITALDTLLLEMAVAILPDLSNTYVFLVSDNGPPSDIALPTTKWDEHKGWPYEGGVLVPLLVWGPGVLPGVEPSLVQSADVPATVCDLLGVAAPSTALDSVSFAATLSGLAGKRTDLFTHAFSIGSTLPFDTDRWAVVRKNGLKLVSIDGVLELFDLKNDPTEQNPLDLGDSHWSTAAALLQATADAILGPTWPN
ncbi:MAG: sulfatase-like hydrolase/transferase [Planctomycetota bacterium]